jgi:hypothetical protein
MECGEPHMRAATEEELAGKQLPPEARSPAICPACGQLSFMVGEPETFGSWAGEEEP